MQHQRPLSLHRLCMEASLQTHSELEANLYDGSYKLSRKINKSKQTFTDYDTIIRPTVTEQMATYSLLSKIIRSIKDLDHFLKFTDSQFSPGFTTNDLDFYTSTILEVSISHEIAKNLLLFDIHLEICRIFTSSPCSFGRLTLMEQKIINDCLLSPLQALCSHPLASPDIASYPRLIESLLRAIPCQLLAEHAVFTLSVFQRNSCGTFDLASIDKPISFILSLSPIQLIYATFYFYRPLEESNILGHSINIINLIVNGGFTINYDTPTSLILREHAVFLACGDVFIHRLMLLLKSIALVTKLKPEFDQTIPATSGPLLRITQFSPVWNDWDKFELMSKGDFRASQDTLSVTLSMKNIFPPLLIFIGNLVGGPYKDQFATLFKENDIVSVIFALLSYIPSTNNSETATNASAQFSRIILFLLDSFIKCCKSHDIFYSQDELKELESLKQGLPSISKDTGILHFCLKEYLRLPDIDPRQNWYLSCLQIALRSGDDFDLYQFNKFGLIDNIVKKLSRRRIHSSFALRANYDFFSEILSYKYNSFVFMEKNYSRSVLELICNRSLTTANETAVFFRSLIISWNYFVTQGYPTDFYFLNFLLANKIRILRLMLFTVSPEELDVSKLCVFNTGIMFLYYLHKNLGISIYTLMDEVTNLISNNNIPMLQKTLFYSFYQMLEFERLFYHLRPRDKLLLETVINDDFSEFMQIIGILRTYVQIRFPEEVESLLGYEIENRLLGMSINRLYVGDRFE